MNLLAQLKSEPRSTLPPKIDDLVQVHLPPQLVDYEPSQSEEPRGGIAHPTVAALIDKHQKHSAKLAL